MILASGCQWRAKISKRNAAWRVDLCQQLPKRTQYSPYAFATLGYAFKYAANAVKVMNSQVPCRDARMEEA